MPPLNEWIVALSVMHIAHHRAATFFSRCHLSLGIVVIFVSALLGASIGEVIFEKESHWGNLLTVLLGVVSAIFAGIQTFLDAQSRSKQHHAAAAAFGEVRRELEQLVFLPSDNALDERLNEVRKKWNTALLGAPNLPAFIHDSVKRQQSF